MSSQFILRNDRVRQNVIDLITRLDLSKPWIVIVRKYVKKRSSSQNSLIHQWFNIIADQVGDDMESVKADFKRMFLPMVERTSNITGEVTMEPKRTRDLKTVEMSEFMGKIIAFSASQLGILLPLPEHMRDVA